MISAALNGGFGVTAETGPKRGEATSKNGVVQCCGCLLSETNIKQLTTHGIGATWSYFSHSALTFRALTMTAHSALGMPTQNQHV
jgi:hypothetical protein